ncbi:exported hypothetical protein [Methylocella tundrae]|uniref:DUF3551 domain-containing protein n=1 Tax=Methylocella tundrae TaxID=227605 RepID=A0A4U8Z820_METTU|nr:exported protein of unknown function [Methylocella tundrae]VTZ48861.1 exported hypothetical protein [Methylocella tundrae]
MLRLTIIATVMGMGAFLGSADAATYCAKYVGGPERLGAVAHSHCGFSTLEECRSSVRARGRRKMLPEGAFARPERIKKTDA